MKKNITSVISLKLILISIFAFGFSASNSYAQTITKLPKPNLKTKENVNKIIDDGKLKAGIYKIRSLQSGMCVGPWLKSGFGDSIAENSNFVMQLANCSEPNNPGYYFNRYVALIPHPFGGFTIRSASPTDARDKDGRYSRCATIARGVVFGPASIDFLPCEADNEAIDFSQIGKPDQRFNFEKLGNNIFMVFTNNGECWDVRDQSINSGTEIIRWICTSAANQKFEFSYIGPLMAGEALNGVNSKRR